MFEVGDRIVCINNKNHSYQIFIGETYIIKKICLKGIIIMDSNGLNEWYESNFISEVEYYRRKKLLKLKERINGIL